MNPILFDVDKLMELAKSNPAELERLRMQEVEKLINNAPEHLRNRLRGLQFQIDCKRKLHPNPLGACIAISRMMMDSLHALSMALHGREAQSPSRATVIPFPMS